MVSELLPDPYGPLSDQDRIGADRPQRRRQPGDHEAEIGLGEVDVPAQQVDRAAASRRGHWQQVLRPPKVDAGSIHEAPASSVNGDGLPGGIAEVEEISRLAAGLANADEDIGDPGLESCAGFEHHRPRG